MGRALAGPAIDMKTITVVVESFIFNGQYCLSKIARIGREEATRKYLRKKLAQTIRKARAMGPSYTVKNGTWHLHRVPQWLVRERVLTYGV